MLLTGIFVVYLLYEGSKANHGYNVGKYFSATNEPDLGMYFKLISCTSNTKQQAQSSDFDKQYLSYLENCHIIVNSSATIFLAEIDGLIVDLFL